MRLCHPHMSRPGHIDVNIHDKPRDDDYFVESYALSVLLGRLLFFAFQAHHLALSAILVRLLNVRIVCVLTAVTVGPAKCSATAWLGPMPLHFAIRMFGYGLGATIPTNLGSAFVCVWLIEWQ